MEGAEGVQVLMVWRVQKVLKVVHAIMRGAYFNVMIIFYLWLKFF